MIDLEGHSMSSELPLLMGHTLIAISVSMHAQRLQGRSRSLTMVSFDRALKFPVDLTLQLCLYLAPF